MTYTVTLETLPPQPIAAVRVRAAIKDIPTAWKPALDQVWAFLRAHDGVRAPNGHNLFLYHHPTQRDQPMDIDFGVQVSERFPDNGDVHYVETPAGQVARTLHIGPYARLPVAHNAIHTWCAQNNKAIGAASWELYGDWTEDDTKLETEIFYLLR